MPRARSARIAQPDGTTLDRRAARALGEACVGALAAAWNVRARRDLEVLMGRGCGHDELGRPKTSNLLWTWLRGTRPSDRVLAELRARPDGIDLEPLREHALWRMCDPDCSLDAIDAALAGVPLPMRLALFGRPLPATRPRGWHAAEAAIAGLRTTPTLDALTAVLALSRLAERRDDAQAHAVAALASFEIAAGVAAQPMFARDHRALRAVLAETVWSRVDSAGVVLRTSADDFEAAVALARQRRLLPTPSPLEVYGALQDRIQAARAAGITLAHEVPNGRSAVDHWHTAAVIALLAAGFGGPEAPWLAGRTNTDRLHVPAGALTWLDPALPT